MIELRRSSIDIVHDILAVCDNGGINKTGIMYRSGLSYDQLRRYLSLLSNKQLIGRNQEGKFQVTPKGQQTLQRVANVVQGLRDLRIELELTGKPGQQPQLRDN